jgi:hypothetical protein
MASVTKMAWEAEKTSKYYTGYYTGYLEGGQGEGMIIDSR